MEHYWSSLEVDINFNGTIIREGTTRRLGHKLENNIKIDIKRTDYIDLKWIRLVQGSAQ
jgi:hypothetical protein